MTEELKIKITAETAVARKEVEKAKKEVTSFKDQVKKASQDVDAHYKAIGDSIKNGLTSAVKAGATALAGVTTAIVALGPATAEYRTNQAKLNAAFNEAGAAAGTAKNVYEDLYRVLGDDGVAVEASNHLAKLTTDQEHLSQWTNICQGIYATFGDSLPIEGLTEAANETVRLGQLTGGLTDAINWASLSGETFGVKLKANTKANEEWNEAVKSATTAEEFFNLALQDCATASEREALIRNTLTGLYGEASAEYEKNAASLLAQNEEQARLQENLAKIGEAIAPVITAFMSFANDALAKVTPYIEEIAGKYGPELKTVLEEVGHAISVAFGYVKENWEVLAAIAGVIAGITAAITLYNIVQAVKTAMAVAEVTTVWGLVAAYAAQAAAMIIAIAPYVLIVAAIAAVIAIIVLCVKHWDEIKAKVKEVMQNIKEKISSAMETIKGKIKSGFESVKTNIINPIKNAYSSVKDTFSKIASTISEKIENAKNKVKSVIDAIKGFFNFKVSWPNIPTPKFSISPAGWSVGDLLKGKIPKLSIKWNALGGVFTKPTLTTYGASIQGLGEDGAEAIVPLEKNTQWLDKIADKLAARQSNTPVILNVDGKTFAKTVINTVNAQTQQTGSLQLKLY